MERMDGFRRITKISGVLFFLVLIAFASLTLSAQEDNDCMDCHQTEGEPSIPYFNLKAYKDTVHADNGCVSCHSDIDELPHKEKLEPVDCSTCHSDEAEEYNKSIHGKMRQTGDTVVPYCKNCHTSHAIYKTTDERSTVSHKNIINTCGKCHADKEIIKNYKIVMPNVIQSYSMSVHYTALNKNGNDKSSTCSDCHSAHLILPAYDKDSTINKTNIAQTCGKCHTSIYETFKDSVHGNAIAKGRHDAPSCPDCHGEHLVKQIRNPQGKLLKTAATKGTESCLPCHESEKLNTKYNFMDARVSSYMDSYHGLAYQVGSASVAKCSSCHGFHDVRPSSDPLSSIHPVNLPQTCGTTGCHPGATTNFTKGVIHKPIDPRHYLILAWIKWIYIAIIVLTIGGMLIHNGLDFFKKLIYRFKAHNSAKSYDRFSLSMRIQHILLTITFSYLAYSGFALKFPNSIVFYPYKLFAHNAEFVRSWSHRVAALIFTLACIYHIYFVLFTKRGRKEIFKMLPVLKDITDLLGVMKYYAGLSKTKPLFNKYTYVEKAEYWALIWGSIVMVGTGVMLWFENTIMIKFGLPKIAVDIAELIHYCEAILATLAIVVWHIYHVVFNPDAYPINWTFLSGKITEEDLKHHHPLEYDKIKDEA